MKHASLFSGIGGFDLAAEWMGWENIFHCEWNPFGQRVLAHHFPNSKSYDDITKTDFTFHNGEVDILTGGFPCQPYSVAGLRKGKADERHLFPEMLRAIKEIQPTYVVGENVRGLVSWGGGMVFNEVCNDLEGEGYAVQPFIIPAASVNAPHKRDRIWFVAYSNNKRRSKRYTEVSKKNGEISERNKDAKSSYSSKLSTWEKFPTVSPFCGGDDGLPKELDGITFPKWKNESIKSYGNAIVPQVALQIFKAINEYERINIRDNN
jgi:DNA (cytosine-5)-methyltransferase 1